MEQLTVRLFGTPIVEQNGEEVRFPYKKAAGLFYYLCVRKSATREEAIHLLWADSGEAAGRKSLREALYQIKKAVGEEVLLLSGQSGIRLNPDFPCQVDADGFPEAAEAYPGEFLEHFYVKNSYECEEWARETRETFRKRWLEEKRRQLDLAAAAGDGARMEQRGEELLRQDPYNEELCGHAMELFAEQGRYNMAIQLYYDLRKRLKEELDLEPGPELQERLQLILRVREDQMGGAIRREEYFFGRSREVYRMYGRIQGLLRGERQCSLVVAGEMGVGKTALLEKVRRMITSHRALVWQAACYESEQEFYLKPWQDLFAQMEELAAQGEMDLRPQEAQAFRSFMSGGESLPASCQRVEQTLLELVGRLAGHRKILLFVDDIQWMDAMSVQLLQRLLLTYGGTQVLLLAGLRPCAENRFAGAMELLQRRELLDTLELPNFTREETEAILRQLLPEAGGSREQAEGIYRETEGNALFLTELIREIREKGFTLEIPRKTAGILESRLARLSREENRVLDAVSVFPERAGIEQLALLLPGPRLPLLEQLEALERQHLLREQVSGGEVSYGFCHRLYGEFVYRRLSEGKRRLWHRQLGEAGEEEYRKTHRLGLLPLLAYHWERAGEQQKFYRYRLQYLKEFYTVRNENYPILRQEFFSGAGGLGDPGGVQVMTDLAREVIRWPDSSRESKSLKMESYYILGRYDIAVGAYREGTRAMETCLRLAGELGSREYQIHGCKQMIFYGIQIQDRAVMEEYLRQGREALFAGGAPEEQAVFDRLEALYLSSLGRFQEAEERLRRILRRYGEPGDGPDRHRMDRAACLNYLGEIYRKRGQMEEACTFYRKALTECGEDFPSNGVGQLCRNLGRALLARGELPEAEKYLFRAVDCFRSNDYRWGWDQAEACLCQLRLRQGNLPAAREHFQRARQLAEQMRTPETLEWVRRLGEQLSP